MTLRSQVFETCASAIPPPRHFLYYNSIMLNNQFQPQSKLPDPVFHIEVDKIKPNPLQPRRDFNEESLKELASSIGEFGILHPLVVTKHEAPTDFGTTVEYHLISGERRLRAAKMAGLERVPAMVRALPTERERLELAIIENIQRENLNPIETARAYAKLQEFGLTQREIAVKVSKSREVVANSVRLLNLPSQIQEAVSKNSINESQARLLLAVSDLKEQQNIFEDLLKNNFSVRDLRARIQQTKEKTPAVPFLPPDPELQYAEEQLREALGTKVRVQKEGQGGKLTISFYSPEELQLIIDKLVKSKNGISEAALPDLSEPKEDFSI